MKELIEKLQQEIEFLKSEVELYHKDAILAQKMYNKLLKELSTENQRKHKAELVELFKGVKS